MKKSTEKTPEFPDFYLPFGGRLEGENRWVQLTKLMPWELIEECYKESMSESGMGAPPLSSRIAYGALIIKERLGVTDAECVAQISENPYLQYFLGLKEYLKKPLFDESMMVYFRSRFTQEHHVVINEEIIAKKLTEQDEDEEPPEEDPPTHGGKLLIDATCTPADIKYPTDLGLLNEAREKTEQIIDTLHAEIQERYPKQASKPKKVRTYRQEARKRFLEMAKAKNPGSKKIRKAIGQQLRYVKRNLKHIDSMVNGHEGLLHSLPGYWYKCLLVIGTLYEQQLLMYESYKRSVPHRIVSISQPHVRPIIRGKAGKKVEFGAKISVSHRLNGYVSLDRLSWEAYNETEDLISQIENYYERYGMYPESVHADQIYHSRKNRQYCKEKEIRLAGKPLGRPRKETDENREELAVLKAQRRQDEIDRIPIEGKFGNVKRKGTLERIMAKLSHTSESVIHVGFIVLNLDKKLEELCSALILNGKNRLWDSLQMIIQACLCRFDSTHQCQVGIFKPKKRCW